GLEACARRPWRTRLAARYIRSRTSPDRGGGARLEQTPTSNAIDQARRCDEPARPALPNEPPILGRHARKPTSRRSDARRAARRRQEALRSYAGYSRGRTRYARWAPDTDSSGRLHRAHRLKTLRRARGGADPRDPWRDSSAQPPVAQVKAALRQFAILYEDRLPLEALVTTKA